MAETTQDVAAVETYLDDWTRHLSLLPTAGITISSAVVTASDGATVAGTAPNVGGTGVVFKLTTAGVATVPSDIVVTVKPTLSNGDTPIRHHRIGVTN